MQSTLENNRENLKKVLKDRWDIEADHWCPIDEASTKEEVVYFPQYYFFKDFGLENLKSVISEISNGNLYHWNWETYKEQFYSIKVEEMVEFNNLEKFYFDDSCDWIVYISHENTIAFGGEKLIELLLGKWENWFKYLNKWEAN